MDNLTKQKCHPCEDAAGRLSKKEAVALLKQLHGWTLTGDKKGVTKTYKMKDFMAAIRYMQKIAPVAEREDHHPDLHLTGYRTLRIELSTHSIGGLSRNDFILAAKIDALPKKLKI
jgi:4a-hydroxytetrahydrobiopterin dehydratase